LNKTVSHLNIAVTILFIISVIMTFLYPEITNALLLSPTEARVIIMTLVSLNLMLYFLQTQLSVYWRIFCLLGSFLTLIESVLMLGAWENILR